MSLALLAAIGISKEAWKRLPAERKRAIRAQFLKGNRGMAKILLKNAKTAQKKTNGKKGKRR